MIHKIPTRELFNKFSRRRDIRGTRARWDIALVLGISSSFSKIRAAANLDRNQSRTVERLLSFYCGGV